MKQITLLLKEEEINLILKALSKLPLEESLAVFLSVRNTAVDQLNPKPTLQEEESK